jgi:hypothetical protein
LWETGGSGVVGNWRKWRCGKLEEVALWETGGSDIFSNHNLHAVLCPVFLIILKRVVLEFPKSSPARPSNNKNIETEMVAF